MDPMATIKETFFQECEEQLTELETGLVAMEEGVADAETVNAAFRAVHSIKGGAGAFKLAALVRFAHAFETVLDLIRGERLAPKTAVMRVMLRSADVLADLVRAARDDEAPDEAHAEELRVELEGLSQDKAPEPAAATDDFGFQPLTLCFDDLDGAAAESTYSILLRPTATFYRRGNEPARLFRELARLGEISVACDDAGLPSFDELDFDSSCLAWRVRLVTSSDRAEVEEVFDFVGDDCELEITQEETTADGPIPLDPAIFDEPAPVAQAETGKPPVAEKAATKSKAEAPPSQTIRIDLDRVDRLANLVGELVINQAMLAQRVGEAGLPRSSGVVSGLAALEQLTREIQDGIMAIRAQPVKPLFQRMGRVVRELAETTGKLARLRTEGEATEIDRTVFEKLADPLTHMIRNAIDHGLEPAEDRIAAGKPEQGEIRLSAAHRSGRIIIDVSDDGRGIDRERVKAKAIERELIAPDAHLTNAEIDNLLFLPGFSTAAKISDISGRGVGMDVVKSSIQALGGRVTISSAPGAGTTFSMSLPLTLAVLDGMVVKVHDTTLVVPITAIVETLRPKSRDLHLLAPDVRLMADRGGFTPLVDVGRELGYRLSEADPLEGVVIVVEIEGSRRCALIVDEIVDQRQVVIKSLETNYRHVPGVAAATILGDGRVALILDIDTFIANSGIANSGNANTGDRGGLAQLSLQAAE